ncbi:ATP-dependent zinc metalloprotease FtsH [Patescibacteria group bacterium AH-259-L07]|nr:ATP-dependent zinc metalloprotease FtsH [Patescibacteria group bacterium AH-259-L07]
MKRQQKSNMKSLIKNFLIFIIIFLILSGIFSLFSSETQKTQEISLNTLISEIQQEKVQEITIEEDKLIIILNDNTHQFAFKELNEPLVELLTNYGIAPEKIATINIKVKSTRGRNTLINIIIPFVLPLLILVGLIYFFSRQVKGAGMQAFKFGESRVRKIEPKDKKIKTTFKDVAGVKEAKEDLEEVVDFLKNPEKYISLGAKIPKGVLLVGPPGCGKTLLARAVAGEANVPFFHISGSEFIEMFVGVGASRVRDLFTKAKKNLPAIVFVDELDAVGRQRGAGLGGSHDEREQTLNQILVELDGFDPNIGLVVLGATNRPDILDPALLRPGRFDRKVILDLPDIGDREEILKIHARGKPLASSVNLKRVAQRTPGFTGADLENLLNEAAILSAKQNKKKIGMYEIFESIERVMLGPERKSHVLSKKEREIVAYHEAGHAIVAHLLPGCDPVQKVSIISRGRAAGYTLKTPEKEKSLRNKSEFLDNIASALGGYASEKIVFEEVTTGAADDLRQATKLTKKLVTEYGMSDILGPRTFGEKEELIFLGREISERRDYSEKIAESIDSEVSKIINTCFNKAQTILEKNRKKLNTIAKSLLKKETLEKAEFNKLMKM